MSLHRIESTSASRQPPRPPRVDARGSDESSRVGEATSAAITVFLGQHFGDGQIYLSGQSDRMVLGQALELGLVNEEGYLTPSGYRFWLRRQ